MPQSKKKEDSANEVTDFQGWQSMNTRQHTWYKEWVNIKSRNTENGKIWEQDLTIGEIDCGAFC